MNYIALGTRSFPVTLAFLLGTLGIQLFIMMSVSLSAGGATGVDGAYWLRVVVTTLIIAGFCGLLVDVLRFLANRFWTRKPKYRIKLRKILKTHLA